MLYVSAKRPFSEKNALAIDFTSTGCANKNNPLGKIDYLSYYNSLFSLNLQLSQRRIRATYAANVVTIFAMVENLQLFKLKSTVF